MNANPCDQNPSSRHLVAATLSPEGRVRAWLTAEVALARAQESVGIVPAGTAARIADAAMFESIDLTRLERETELVGFPITPLVKQIVENCDEEAAQWVHWGSTTQDIVDSGLMLQARDVLNEIEKELIRTLRALMNLAVTHRETVMVGRTFQQHAAPITFGFKASVWLDELLRHLERFDEMRPRVLVGQCGGAVGTLASLGTDGLEVRRRMMAELGLGQPEMTWHTARDRWAELVTWLGMLGATLGKISMELVLLMRTEVGEASEPTVAGRGVSSAMPQKRNPTVAPRVIAIAHRLRDSVPSQLSAMIQDHERGAGSMPLEWMVVPESLGLAYEALSRSADVLENLEVDDERMRENLQSDHGLLMAEAAMMSMAARVGRPRATQIVSGVVDRVAGTGESLRSGLLGDARVMAILDAEEVSRVTRPETYLGSVFELVDAVVARASRRLGPRS